MFDLGLGATELFVIAMIALIVVGPKDLPRLLRSVGQMTNKVRALAREFQGHLEEAAKDTGLDEVKKDFGKMTNFTVTDLDRQGADIKKAIEEEPAAKPTGPEDKPQESIKSAQQAGGGTSRSSDEKKPAAAKPKTKRAAKAKSAAKAKPAAKPKPAAKSASGNGSGAKEPSRQARKSLNGKGPGRSPATAKRASGRAGRREPARQTSDS